MEIKYKVYKKKDKWVLNYIHPTADKRTRKSFERKKHCYVFLEELKNMFVEQKENQFSQKTLKELSIKYIEKYPETQLTKTRFVYNDFISQFGDQFPIDIRSDELVRWLNRFKKLNRLSTKSISNYKAQLNTIFKYLKRHGYIKESPLDKISIHPQKEQGRLLCQNELDLIFENLFYFSPFYLYRFFWLMFELNLSKFELCEMKWEHIDFQSRLINVNNPRTGHLRSIELAPQVEKFLAAMPKRCEYVITNRFGRKVDRNNISRRILILIDRYPNTPYFSTYDFKRTAKHLKIKAAREQKTGRLE